MKLDQTYSKTANANNKCYNMTKNIRTCANNTTIIDNIYIHTLLYYIRTCLILCSTWCSQFRTTNVEQQTLEKPGVVSPVAVEINMLATCDAQYQCCQTVVNCTTCNQLVVSTLLKNIIVNLDHFPRVGVNIKKYLKPLPR